MKVVCDYCKNECDKKTGHVNRSRTLGAHLYCGRKCSGLGRRSDKTISEKKEAKRLYDVKYRDKNLETIKKKKRDYAVKHYAENPEKFRQIRKKKYKKHLEYLRTPEYKAYKKEYDLNYRASEFGDFSEAYKAVLLIDKEVKKRMTTYEIKLTNNTLNKALQRGRNGQTKRSYT